MLYTPLYSPDSLMNYRPTYVYHKFFTQMGQKYLSLNVLDELSFHLFLNSSLGSFPISVNVNSILLVVQQYP